MAIPKLYRILQQIPAKWIDSFGMWLESPLHHQHSEAKELWRVLRIYAPEYGVSDEVLFGEAFPKAAYDNARLRVLRNHLLVELESFMVWKELDGDEGLKDRLLRKISLRVKSFEMGKGAWEASEPPVIGDTGGALRSFLMAEQKLERAISYGTRYAEHDLDSVVDPLNTFYVITRLKYYCAQADPMTRLAPLERDGEMDLIFLLFASKGLEAEPLAAIYFHLLQLFLGEPPESHLPALKHLLAAHHGALDPFETLNLYTYWFNFLNFQNRKGVPGSLRQIFELYQQMAELDVLFGEGSFAANHFRNIVVVASNLGEFDWGYRFLERYSGRLMPPWRDGIHSYCLAFLLFFEGRYSEAKHALLDAEFYDWGYKLGYYVLMMQIYYETDDWEGMESMGQSLKAFLYRAKEIPKIIRESALQFLRFALRLFHIKHMVQRHAALTRAKLAIANTPQVRGRDWLVKKVGEMGI